VAGGIRGQQRGGIHVQGQEIANGILIFGAIEPANGFGAAGFGLS
jgi:hypothetical protein